MTVTRANLLDRIGTNRTVLVDACVSIRLAKALRKAGLTVRHMNEINPRMPDTHIEALIMEPADVLITHDFFFARYLGPKKAIHIRSCEMNEIKQEAWYIEATKSESRLRLAESTKGPLLVLLPFAITFFICYYCSVIGRCRAYLATNTDRFTSPHISYPHSFCPFTPKHQKRSH
jgi:predicted nuclease of predicted toxin-antitoxin system